MKKFTAQVISVHSGSNKDSTKDAQPSIQLELEGIVGDAHKSYERSCWAGGDKQPEGTVRRNERQWSAVSAEELQQISEELDLTENISASCVGANLCFEGISELSRLPKGTILKFPSGAELSVEEYNPPCGYMGEKVASLYSTRSGEALTNTAFSKAAKLTRGIVGVVEVAGAINAGDEVTVEIYETPAWLVRSDSS
ncbi:MAG: MOSC domain-containing protein [Woeseiaceae bacterium]